ncbi:class I SAM-dependent DNA methyltransferase [Herbaspirillum lusitanum]|nr:SAM-dependent methyltransferase [Herbaspirillum lusitanum]
MAAESQAFDLVLAADTLIYFGDLEKVFDAVASTLRSAGHFVFTVEAVMPEAGQVVGFQLHPSGRYRHGTDYVMRCLAAAGLTLVSMTEATLREEIRQPVKGVLAVAQRT